MSISNQPVIDFLETRRSRPAKTLKGPFPTSEELVPILRTGVRVPDHGKLEPWRLIVFQGAALKRLAEAARQRAHNLGKTAQDTDKAVSQFTQSGLAVAVVESPKASDKIPMIEQTYSAGAVCLSVLNAALAHGWGANWLSGWICHDPQFCTETLGLAPHERIAGMIHIGTETTTPPERPRPDLETITTWVNM